MARPRKWRKVCCLPYSGRFGPLNASIDQDRGERKEEFDFSEKPHEKSNIKSFWN